MYKKLVLVPVLTLALCALVGCSASESTPKPDSGFSDESSASSSDESSAEATVTSPIEWDDFVELFYLTIPAGSTINEPVKFEGSQKAMIQISTAYGDIGETFNASFEGIEAQPSSSVTGTSSIAFVITENLEDGTLTISNNGLEDEDVMVMINGEK